MLIRAEGKTLILGEKQIQLEYTIRELVEFSNCVVVLIYDRTIIANNVITYDKTGKMLWKINDILKIIQPTGMVGIEKSKQGYLKVFSGLDILYLIDVENRSVVDKIFLRYQKYEE